ncbi:MAG: aminotransferase class I/II-fold pyridoxal phosphate-dependent enzyme [Gemmatimonadaceae bacterium]
MTTGSRGTLRPLTESFPALLARRAEETPQQVAFHFVGDDGGERATLTYAALWQRVATVADALRQTVPPASRVMVCPPPGPEYVVALFACLTARMVAVPAYPPHPHRDDTRIVGMVRDADAAAVLCDNTRGDPRSIAAYAGLTPIDLRGDGRAEVQRDAVIASPALLPDALAMLQYTSGSMGDPRGVMLTHANLLANAQRIQQASGHQAGEPILFWLPPYHDMGLMGGIFSPVYLGAPGVLMAPSTFMQRPFRWMEAMSRYRAVFSGAPNFAYALCTARVTEADKATLDLSAWRVAFNGAEPVRNDTMVQFVRAFAPCGLSPAVFFPCYGLAEATLLVSGGTVSNFEQAPVSCGHPANGLTVQVVDPEHGTVVPDGTEGELWVQGDSVAAGYWRRPDETATTFGGRLPHLPGTFLRTGDLGLLRNGAVHVTGRRKALIIVQGRNVQPADVEFAAANAHPLLRPAGAAAFQQETTNGTALIVVAEMNRHGPAHEAPAVIDAVRTAVTTATGVTPDRVILTAAHTLPRTTSGKLRRAAIAAQWGDRHMLALVDAMQSLGVAIVMPAKPLTAHGLESIDMVRLQLALETAHGLRVETQTLWEAPSLDALVQQWPQADDTTSTTPGLTRANSSSRDTVPAATRDLLQWPEIQAQRARRAQLAPAGANDLFFAVHQGIAESTTQLGDRTLLNFASYNYLGLSGHPAVTAAAQASIAQYGTSVSASRLIAGERPIHAALESALAQFVGVESALTFVGGHATNVSVIAHLMGPGDLICCDARVHNSAMQGALSSGARVMPIAHNDTEALDTLLHAVRASYRRVLVIIEGVYSADGDVPDLAAYVAVKDRHDALLMVDEAHALGVLGATGRGLAEACGVAPEAVDIWMGTLSKALASAGGYIAGSAVLVEYLRDSCPGFVFSVGLAPAAAAAALAALQQLQLEPIRVQQLQHNAQQFRALAREAGLPIPNAWSHDECTPIVPLIVGDAARALRLSRALRAAGVEVPPMIAPAVPQQEARLRFFLSSAHTPAQLHAAVTAAAACLAAER